MALAEILLTNVGVAVTRKVVELWIEDPDFSLQVSTDITKVIARYTTDAFTKDKAKQYFDRVRTRTAETLKYIFEAERSFDENQLEAVADAIGLTIDKVHLTSDIIFSSNLNAEILAKYFNSNRPDNILVGLSESEINLYKRMLIEVSNLIIEINASMGRFQEKAFSETFDRQQKMFDLLEQVLEKIQKIWDANQVDDSENQSLRFESDYKRAIVRRLDEMILFGASTFVKNRKYPLSVAYVSLSISHTSEDISDDGDISGLRVEDAIVSSNHLLVVGDAGSGKTTLLKWIAVQIALKSFDEALDNWNDKVPFFIRLRAFADTPLPSPEDFPELISNAFIGDKPANWVTSILRQGRGIVLIDGVDEVDDRETLKAWIEELSESYKDSGNIFIVTSRPTAVESGWLNNFQQVSLDPMNTKDIHTFIDHWHDAIAQEVKDPDALDQLPSLSANIKSIIADVRTIRNLATNPLLCALLCALHRDMNQKLPAGRRDLYDACLQMLVEMRDEERQISLIEYPKLDYPQKIALLQDLAFHMMDTNLTEIAFDRAEARIAVRLERMRNLPSDITAKRVLKLLLDRTGIIREPSSGRVDFTHRTFEEYLAALEINEQNNLEKLLDKTTDDKWREVIILSAGIIRPSEREKLIQDIIRLGDLNEEYSTQCYLLAFSCLDTVVDKLRDDVSTELDRRMVKVVPPKSMEQANAVAKAGAIAIPYLGRYSKSRANEAAASIRALSLIAASDEALVEDVYRQLVKFRSDERKTVINELIRAFDEFEPEQYYNRILSYIHTRHIFDISASSRIQNIIPYLPQISEITSYNLDNKIPINILTKLPKLKHLKISEYVTFGYEQEDINSLSYLADLETFFYVTSANQIDVSFLSNFRNLKIIILGSMLLRSRNILLDYYDYQHLNSYLTIINFNSLALSQNLEELFIVAGKINHFSLDSFYRLKICSVISSIELINIENKVIHIGETLEYFHINTPTLPLLDFSQSDSLEVLAINTGNIDSLSLNKSIKLKKLMIRVNTFINDFHLINEQVEEVYLEAVDCNQNNKISLSLASCATLVVKGNIELFNENSQVSNSVKHLCVGNNNMLNIKTLANQFPNIQELVLNDVENIDYIDHLSDFQKLTTLKLEFIPNEDLLKLLAYLNQQDSISKIDHILLKTENYDKLILLDPRFVTSKISDFTLLTNRKRKKVNPFDSWHNNVQRFILSPIYYRIRY